MFSHRIAYSILMMFIGIFALQWFIYYPLLPDNVATHFTLSGNADGWSPKSHLMFSMSFAMIMIALVLPGITILLQRIPQYINLPNKEYWLAPERRETTLFTLTSYILSLGNTSSALLVVIVQMILLSNINGTTTLGQPFLIIVCLFMLTIFSIVIAMILKFSRTKA